ncbi:TetR/AcrR family transcriptional regulator [Cognatishimia sp.]|uniref:TetR/AcrR family transcriptional regulator n=1 Tax=Cognatishimia sp. TaxID=2211648 RepID=UPI0035174B71|nr:TetR/AcrR family transcriptional regulator [Cognatishimia sp.]
MTDTVTQKDSKTDAILLAAFDTFRAYGFRRTSMEDIAKAAGMSRAALYLHFRNKEDIQRSMTVAYYDSVATKVEEALAQDGSVTELLTAAFAEHAGEAFKLLLESPHGDELLDSQNHASHAEAQNGQQKVSAIYAAWLVREKQAGRIAFDAFGGDADIVAEILSLALYGLKAGQSDYAGFDKRRDFLARMFAASLTK